MTGQKIALVTGAYGSIGRHVASDLAKHGWSVHGIGHGEWSRGQLLQWGLSAWHQEDVSLDGLRSMKVRPSLIVHCAGSGSVGASIAEPYIDFQRTVAPTAAILEFLRVDCPGAALVYPSSAAVYGIADKFPMSEDSPLRPTSPYGVHKRSAEELVREYARLFGLNASVVRLFSIYGEGFRKQLLWDACRRIMVNEYEFFGTGSETRDWLHVSDAAALMVRAADYASPRCPVVNGGGGVAVTVRDVVAELFALMNRKDQAEFCGTVRPGDPSDYQADIRQALAWGWQPRIPWKDGLALYVSWFQREHGLL